MNKQELFEQIKGQMIISCQAIPGEPLYVEEKSVMYLMARAAKMAGDSGDPHQQHPGRSCDQGGDRTSGYRTGKDPVSRL